MPFRFGKYSSAFAQLCSEVSNLTGHTFVNTYRISDFGERSLLLQGRLAANAQTRGRQIRDLSEVEFRVFSQWGEDGIIDWLCAHVPVPNTRFVEFGVETFAEANCRFLMQNRNWKGLVIDGSEANMRSLRDQAYFWKYDLTALTSFVTAENINALIADAGFGGPLGLLSIDVDGNDYWIWKNIDVVSPAIVVCEVNPILGDKLAITVPYDPSFTRFEKHYSGLFFGASIGALRHCAKLKGYSFLGTNANGINAFFVQDSLASSVTSLLSESRAFAGRHRDSRDEEGRLSFKGGLERLALISDMSVVDVTTGDMHRIGDLTDLYSDSWLADF